VKDCLNVKCKLSYFLSFPPKKSESNGHRNFKSLIIPKAASSSVLLPPKNYRFSNINLKNEEQLGDEHLYWPLMKLFGELGFTSTSSLELAQIVILEGSVRLNQTCLIKLAIKR
jgi:hypothetical protein